jgi:hypothetical protein
MPDKKAISTSDIPEFQTGSRLTADMFNNIILLMENVATKHGAPIQPQKRYSIGSTLTASDMNNFVANINKIYEHIGLPIPNWSFGSFKTSGAFRSSDLNEIVKSIKVLETTAVADTGNDRA